MGFKGESKRTAKTTPRPVSAIGMILIFIVVGVSVFLGYWLPGQYYDEMSEYLPFTSTWSLLMRQLATGIIAFILLQFVVVMIQGFIAPPPPEDMFDKDGLYIGKRKK